MGLVTCPLCEYGMRKEELNNHYANKHPGYPGPRFYNEAVVTEEEVESKKSILVNIITIPLVVAVMLISIPIALFNLLNDKKFWEGE